MKNLLFIFAVFATVLVSCDKPGDDQGCTSTPGSFCNTDSNPDAVYTPPVVKMTKGIINESITNLKCDETVTGIREFAVNEEGHLVVLYTFSIKRKGINHPIYQGIIVSVEGDPIYNSKTIPTRFDSGVLLINTGVTFNNGVLAKDVSIKSARSITEVNVEGTPVSVDTLKSLFADYSSTIQEGDCLTDL